MLKITMIGAGYVGLVSGACFAEFGFDVTCIDKQPERIAMLQNGQMPFYEPGLGALVQKNRDAKRLHFSDDLAKHVAASDAVFIAVGTPSRRGDGHADLTYVFSAAEEIADALSGYTLVITKSTVPVGTGREVAARIRARNAKADFDICSNPEFLREGSAINDFMRPDRIVIGTDSERATDMMRMLYRPLNLNEVPLLATSLEAAELIKYAANAFLATKITFINQMADLCEQVGADVQDIARGIGLDGRIGRKFLHAGPGYGGSCFPKDARALVQTAREAGAPATIVEAVVDYNEARKLQMARRIINAMDGAIHNKKIAVLGVTFKPNTDDMREAPSLTVIPALQKAGAKIFAHDPAGMSEAAKLIKDVTWCDDVYEAVKEADALVILTEWNEFRALDLTKLKNLMQNPLIIDLRNIYKTHEMQAAGFIYHSIGRPAVGRASARAVPRRA